MNYKNENDYPDDEIDLKELFGIFYDRFFLISGITTFFILASLAFAFLSPNKYTSFALLSNADTSGSISSPLSNFSGFAGLAGISMSGESGNKIDESIARIYSLNFFVNNFLPNIKPEDLFASKGWNAQTNQLIYDSDIYDSSKNLWVGKGKTAEDNKPSFQEFYKKYKKILSISVDKNTNFITISIEQYSPYLAKEWIDVIINNINYEMKALDQKRAESSILFLNEYAKENNLSEIEDAINNLLEQEMNNLMLASAKDSYVFNIIQPSFVPEERSSPDRLVILLIGLFLSFVAIILFAIIPHYWNK